MGQAASSPAGGAQPPQQPLAYNVDPETRQPYAVDPESGIAIDPSTGKPFKLCCSCLPTKKRRDTCVLEEGEENCADAIDEHKRCLRSLGFKI
ncbi:MAG: cytochrome c oxidase assembly protein [Olpidium bornovanus]|uniref:Cytochrome c oxidase assembly protein n=1 Tax=Olpidium bornovanus TaxID=278681 RepID=A0A8H7ZR88_9FUNG|nr:MAG: cytochrome c oxidase assembly protein [Olpidium bornovanus]